MKSENIFVKIIRLIKVNIQKLTFSKANPDLIEFRIISFPCSKVCAGSTLSFPREIQNVSKFRGWIENTVIENKIDVWNISNLKFRYLRMYFCSLFNSKMISKLF